jgi:hypothetical protein
MSLIDFGAEAEKLFRVVDEIFHGRSGLNKPIGYLRGEVILIIYTYLIWKYPFKGIIPEK